MARARPRAIYCHGGPLHGYGFTEDDWQKRQLAERNMQAATGKVGKTLGYREGRREGLPGGLSSKTLEALGRFEVRVWVPSSG